MFISIRRKQQQEVSWRDGVIGFFLSEKGKTQHHKCFPILSEAFSSEGGRVGRLQAAAFHILGSYSRSVSHLNSGVYLLNEVWCGDCLVATGH